MKKLSPRNARTLNDVVSLKRDNITRKYWWILTDGHTVSIVNQKVGERPSQSVEVPRGIFNALVDWYMRDQRIEGDNARRR